MEISSSIVNDTMLKNYLCRKIQIKIDLRIIE